MPTSQMWRPILIVFISFFLWMIPCAAQNQVTGTRKDIPDRRAQYVAGELLVRFKASASESQSARVHERAGSSVRREFAALPGLQLVQLPNGTKVEEALALYRTDPGVLYAEPNYRRQALDNPPNDLYFRDLWNLHNTGQRILFDYPPASGPTAGTPGADIRALEAWSVTTGSSGVVIAVTDTGVDYTHEDLAANMYQNAAECNHNGVDDDGNGYVDDCYGINALDKNGDPMDDMYHGTHVAGTIGAVGNNGLGVAGVSWNVKILACKFLGWYGGTDADAIACLDYLALMHDRGVDIVASNNSWGGYGYSQALYDAIDAHRQRGMLFIAAAGNDANDNDGAYALYPASYALSNIISVAATSFDDTLTNFSSFGAHSVHLGAPGNQVLSTTPQNTYTVLSGTSMAAPHVTGVAALLQAQDLTRDWRAIKNLILTSTDPLSTLSSTVTHGRVNALKALTCQNASLQAPLLPRSSFVFANGEQGTTLAGLNIVCAAAAGSLQVSVSPGAQQVTLADDGVVPDQSAGDGTYSARWVPAQGGLYRLTFPGGQTISVAVDPYTFATTSFQYRAFSGTNLALTDNTIGFVDSPFALSFAGGAYEGVYVSDNGYLSFESAVPFTANALPYEFAQTLIAPFWTDLVPAATGNVYWTVNGTAPQRELVIEWRNLAHAGCKLDGSESVAFQVVFFEGSTDIVFNYRKTAFGGTCTANDRGAASSIGVQASTTAGKQYSLNTASLQDNTALLWRATLMGNPVPSIQTVNPGSWYADVFDAYVDVIGSNFGRNSVLLVNGAPRTTYVFSERELYGVILASDIKNAGTTLQLSVFNGLPEGGPSAPVAFAVNAPDFTVRIQPTTITLRAGQSSSVTVFVNPHPVFNDGVSLSCSGLPAPLTCAFDPSRILPLGFAVLTITSLKSTAAQQQSEVAGAAAPRGSGWNYSLVVGVGMLVAGVRLSRKRLAVLAVIALALLLGLGGCGGTTRSASSGSGGANSPLSATTTAGTYTVAVTGTSGARQHSANFSVTVTP